MRNALGKGLAQLIGEAEERTVREVLTDSIVPNPHQPRRQFDEDSLNDLAESIKQVGLLQPLIVRPVGQDKYELIAGERRLRAARIAGLRMVPVVIRGSEGRESLLIALVENLQRQDISPLEQADAYRVLIGEFGLTQEEIAKRVGKSRAAVANAVRLLKLPSEIRDALSTGKISEGHAKALLQFESETEMVLAYRRILEKGLSVREVEQLARGMPVLHSRGVESYTPNPLETALSEFFGSPCRVIKSGKRGKVVIEFFDEQDLSRILSRLGLD